MCMMTMFIKKFASYLIFGKISLGYKEHEILEMKHITEDLIVDLTGTKTSKLKICREKPVCQKYYSFEAIFHLELDEDETQCEISDFNEKHTNHIFQVKREKGLMISEDESLSKKLKYS
ncbi:uncharacterized protein LOC126555866 [Aphis gossypii]|uniref:uncharacterized protein LOC126555866 n=1 Tax=Aphis gossypii TaxID=80765 RepID=UPI002158EF3F|nr:uncharacterized protein LOC126555866 [Aphis gossypii]XP_050066748.1 uncharacterized protein LOC126555866 [Aphis gossypii]XP_050066749.1 uncharacterized protein LOC126555866 [Aphis gossypii]